MPGHIASKAHRGWVDWGDGANLHFPPAPLGARQQQVRHVGAGDQQHHGYRGVETEKRGPGRFDQPLMQGIDRRILLPGFGDS